MVEQRDPEKFDVDEWERNILEARGERPTTCQIVIEALGRAHNALSDEILTATGQIASG